MRKNLLSIGVLVSAFVLASCSGGNKNKENASVNQADMENAAEVIKYYTTSLNVLKETVVEKDVNAVLGYMEQRGKGPMLPAIAPPAISEADTMEVMNPGTCFNEETRQNLKQNYAGLFRTRTQFYDNFNTYLSLLKSKNTAKTDTLLQANYQLSIEMSEYKQNIFDILSPFTEAAERVLWADNPLKEQIISVRKMSGTMESIVNLYAHKHAFDGIRIDVEVTKLTEELEAAKKLPAVSGHEGEMKSYQAFLSQVETFLKQVRKRRSNTEYSEEDYEMLMNIYATSII